MIYVGTSGYAYKEWKGTFYPADLPAKGMLAFYASQFPSVEVNNTFYRMPAAATVGAWADETPPGFSFVLKAPQRITHRERLKGSEESTRHFLAVASELAEKKGPVLFQLPPNFKKDLARLESFVQSIPASVKVAFEFRHASWFADDVYALLRSRDMALCIADSEAGTTPLVSTASWGYARLRELAYDDLELARWARNVKDLKFSQAWVFFKHEDEGRGPVLARRFREVLAAESLSVA